MHGDIRNDKEYPELMQYLRESYHLVINAELNQTANDEQITVFQIETKEDSPGGNKSSQEHKEQEAPEEAWQQPVNYH